MKKLMRRLLAVVAAMTMVLGMAIPTMAATGSYTITIGNAKNGETYTAYKIFDADYDETQQGTDTVSYTASSKIHNLIKNLPGTAGLTFTQIGTSDTYTVVKGDNFSAANFAAGLDTIKDQLTSAGNATAANDMATISNLSAGYYFVDTTLGSLCSLDTAKNVTINEKNEIPTLEKKESKDQTDWKDAVNAAIGDTVYYKLTVTDQKGTDSKITVHDTLDSQLTLNTDSFKVQKDGQDVAAANYTIKTTDLTDGCTFEVELHDDYVKTLNKDDAVVITYNAKVNKTAVANTVYNNKAHLEYSHQATQDDTVTVKTSKLVVLKYDGTDTAEVKTPLAGAVFQLQTADGKAVNLVKDSDTAYHVADATETATPVSHVKDGALQTVNNASVVSDFVTVSTGKIAITGLDPDDAYKLEEIMAPAGYNKLTSKEVVAADTTAADRNANVANNKGIALPSTGGTGTTIFYILGAALVIGAGVVLVTRRRLSK